MSKIINLPFDTPKQKATTSLKLFCYYFIGGILSWGFARICSDIGGLYWTPGPIFGIFFFIMHKPIIEQSYKVSDYLFILISSITYFIAIYLFFHSSLHGLGLFVCGFLGSVLLSVGFYCIKRVSNFLPIFFTTVFLGGIGGYVFFSWLGSIDNFYLAFAMWQGCVGTTLNIGYLIGEKQKVSDACDEVPV